MSQKKNQNKLTKEQLSTVTLLSVGSLLEHFDRMLYIHIGVVLNELFFPQTDPLVKAFIPAFAFCSSYFLTPLGALFFGYIGDAFGRKSTIVISSLLMAICCLTVAFLPTYKQIGITATVVLTFCRMIQGMSGISEITGVEIYLTESVKPPVQYTIVALIPMFQRFGSILALSIASLFINTRILPEALIKDGWRIAFLIGALIGAVGGIARSSLKEASEFADGQRLLKKQYKEIPHISVSLSTSIAYFFIYCSRPLCFYFIFVHCSGILKNTFHMSTAQVISNNLLPTTLNTLSSLLTALLSYTTPPLKIVKIRATVFLLLVVLFPIVVKIWHSPNTVLLIQCLLAIFRFEYIPGVPIFLKYFPMLKRFRYASVLRTLAETLTYVITSFSLVIFTRQFGNNGILLILLPIGACFAWSLRHFEKKEEKSAKKESILPRTSECSPNS